MIKKTLYINGDDYDFIKRNGLSPSSITREAIIEAMKGRLRATRRYGKVKEPKVIRVWITEEQDEFIRENGINLSALFREKVRALRSL